MHLWTKNLCAIANDHQTRGLHAFCDDARPHVVAENDDAFSAAQRPPMHFFPNTRKNCSFYDVTPDGHIRIQVADVVHIRPSLQHGHERSNDSLKRRIGHRQHYVAVNK